MTKIQAIDIAVELFDDPEFEDERVGPNGVGLMCWTELVASRGVSVEVVERACKEKEANRDEKDEELGGTDEVGEIMETELVKPWEERDADGEERGKDRE